MNKDELKILADKMAIQDTVTRYAHAVDTQNFDLLDQVFTQDADLDYRQFGGIRGDRAQVKKWLQESRRMLHYWHHLLSNIVIRIEGDMASARTDVHAVLGLPGEDSNAAVMHVGAYYSDELVRGSDGWLISTRVFVPVWTDGNGAAGMEPKN